MSLKVGDKAPDFTLINREGQKVSLKNFLNKQVVLLFFPFANSSVCYEEMCSTRDNLKDYEDLDANVLGISVDSHYSLKLWAEKLNLNFPLLSDFNRTVIKDYGVMREGGFAERATFVIDQQGKI